VSIEAEPETDIPPESQSNHQFCPICQIYIAHYIWSQHAKGHRHQPGQEYTGFKMVQSEAEMDKNDVAIQGDLSASLSQRLPWLMFLKPLISVRLPPSLESAKLSAEIEGLHWRVSPWVVSSNYF